MSKAIWFADVIAAVVVLSLVAFVALALTGFYGASLAAVTLPWYTLYAFVVVMSATKLYGKSVYRVVSDRMSATPDQ